MTLMAHVRWHPIDGIGLGVNISPNIVLRICNITITSFGVMF